MSTTPRLALPIMEASQAQKHVTHNEALVRLDAAVQLSVADRDLAAPPPAPTTGSRYLVAAGASGAWVGGEGAVACERDGAWDLLAPRAGWFCWVEDESLLLVHDGTAWRDFATVAGLLDAADLATGLPRIGVNTAADTTNRLAVKANAVLLSHDDVTPGTGDLRVTLNKSAAARDAGFVFQDAWSTRALFGLLASDDVALKVSPDGSSFVAALTVDRTTGRLTLAVDLPVSEGGTGASTAAAARANLGAAASGANADVTSLTGLTTPLSLAQGGTGAATATAARAALAVDTILTNFFAKADPSSVAFTCPTAQTVSLKAGTEVFVAGLVLRFLVDTPVTLPTLTAGTDYAIYACADGTLQASANFSAPSGHTIADSRKIGGFHYAAGSNAAAQAGGNTTPQINPYSLWDLKWRPSCPDPRGMTLVAGRFWSDIYLTGTDVDADGSSRSGATIADGSSPPKVPTMFGGDGSTTYGSFTWFEARELLASVGKDLLGYGEMIVAAYGVTEGAPRGSDPVTTGLSTTNTGSSNADNLFTSKWGLVQAAGCMWTWGRDQSVRLVVPAAPADATALATSINTFAWRANTEGRGSVYVAGSTDGLVAALFGGHWGSSSNCGSRCSAWGFTPWASNNSFGARGRADHVWSI